MDLILIQISPAPSIVCNTSTEFNLSILPPGRTVIWTKSSNLTYLSGQGTTEHKVRAASSATSGAGWVQATINGPCGSVQLPKHDVWVGTPMPSQPIVHYKPGYYSVCKRVSHTASTTQQSGVTDYQWQLIYPDGFTWPLSSGSSTTTFCIDDTGGPYKVGVKTKMDGCNWSEEVTKSFYVEDCGSGGDCGGSGGGLVPKLIVSPNPASHDITITEVERANDQTPWVLRLMSQQGTVMVSVSTTLPKTINLSGFHPGTYILHARRGQYLEKQVVIVE